MSGVMTAHTAQLGAREHAAIRALLDDSFAGHFSDHDAEHALGGLHALVWDGPVLAAHGAVVMRRLLHRGRSLRAGYVEGVAVRSDRRRRGHATSVMATLEDVIRRAYDLGALGASDEAADLYQARGWQRWAGTTSVLAPGGIRRTPEDDGGVHVLAGDGVLDVDGDLACDWREGDVW